MREDLPSRGPAAPDHRPGSTDRVSWLRTLFQAVSGLTSVSAERREKVLEDTYEGSQPTPIYYVLLGLSELIAGFALMINSDATLIGANVVAPLMTPIFGVSLGLMRGDLKLLRSALMAEFGGAALGVLLCFGLGLLPFAIDPSPSLLAQTHPTLIDLLVAALAGFAGGLAMIDERVSPALPGVAIATALNPPIAAIGLCLAYGAYDGAWGAFILFFANVLAILAVAAVLFLVAGFVTREEIGSVRGLVRRFAAAAVGLVLVTVLLTNYLVGMVQDLQTTRTINDQLEAALELEPGTALDAMEYRRHDGGVDVLSTIRTPRVLSPDRVQVIQQKLAAALGVPVRLYMRCGVTKDVVAAGTVNLRPYRSIGEGGDDSRLSRQTLLLQEAEQVARETVAARPELVLNDVELVELPSGAVVIFSIQTPREPSTDAIATFERRLRERLRDEQIHVVVRTVDSRDATRKGRILFGESHFGEFTPEQAAAQAAVEDAVRRSLQAAPDTFVLAVDAIRRDDAWLVRAEVVGPRVLTPEEVRGAEKKSATAVGAPVAISVRSSTDLVVTGKGYDPVGSPTILDPAAPNGP